MPKTILLTGGLGYIGSHVNLYLGERGIHTLVLDNLSTGHPEALVAGELIEGDIRDQDLLNKIFSSYRVEAVMHFSACSLVEESVRNPLKYFDNNVKGTLTLLEAMVENSIPALVFSSTAAVYGEGDNAPLTETSPTNPGNPYGLSKRMVEHMLHETSRAHDLHYIALRYFNAAGADPEGRIGEDHNPETHLIPLVIKAMLGQRDSFSVYGHDYPTPDGTAMRDYIHVMDLAEAHWLSLKSLLAQKCEGIFNLGNEKGFSVMQVIGEAEKLFGIKKQINMAPRRSGDPAVLIASSEKIRRELEWEPKLSGLEHIIKSARKWHQTHPNGYSGPAS